MPLDSGSMDDQSCETHGPSVDHEVVVLAHALGGVGPSTVQFVGDSDDPQHGLFPRRSSHRCQRQPRPAGPSFAIPGLVAAADAAELGAA